MLTIVLTIIGDSLNAQVHATLKDVKTYGARGDGLSNDTKAILNAISTLNDRDTLFLDGIFLVTPQINGFANWEIAPAVFNLPDKNIVILGKKGTIIRLIENNQNAMAMFRTAIKSTKRIEINNLIIEGRGNSGVTGNLIDGIAVNGSSNGVFKNITITDTKRHGIYMFYGANNNNVENVKIFRTNREMLGCGIQLEGADHNQFRNIYMEDIGANGIDLNSWNNHIFYPININSPYTSVKKFSNSNVFVNITILNIGVNNNTEYGYGGTCNPDDDYYGVNIINKSNQNSFKELSIKNVRLKEGKIMPAKSSYASPIRIMNSSGCKMQCKSIFESRHPILNITDSENCEIIISNTNLLKPSIMKNRNRNNRVIINRKKFDI